MPLTSKIADVLQARGRSKGLLGESSSWLAVWVLVSGVRWVKRRFTPHPVVVREVLLPGQQLLVTHFGEGAEPDDGSRRRRRRREIVQAQVIEAGPQAASAP